MTLEQPIRQALLSMADAADAESCGDSDAYHVLLAAYHREFDASWMPRGYGMAARDPSIPLRVDMSNLRLLSNDKSTLFDALSKLGKG